MIGSTLFYAQRLTAVFLLGYSLWLLSFFILNQPLEYNIWVFFTDQMHFLILTSIMAIIIAIHSFIGLWTIGTDYFTSRTLGFLSPAIAKHADVIRGLYSLLFTIWGISIIIFILLIIWS